MSYNIDSVEIVHKHGFCITRTRLTALDDEVGARPESSIFDLLADGPSRGFSSVRGPDGVELICPLQFWWSGEGSGRCTDELEQTLAAFEGDADLVLTWEGGDSHTGLRLRNHKVTKHEVVMALGPEVQDS